MYLVESIILKQIITFFIQYKTRKYFSNQLQNIQATAKDKILSQVSHDQRTQLSALKMYTEQIVETLEVGNRGTRNIMKSSQKELILKTC